MADEAIERLHAVIDALAVPEIPVVPMVEEAVGTTLQPAQENPHFRFYLGVAPHLPRPAIHFRRHREGTKAILIFGGQGAGPHRDELGLSRYGDAPKLDVNPNIPPRGTVSYGYERDGVKIFFQFENGTDVLRTVAVHWDG